MDHASRPVFTSQVSSFSSDPLRGCPFPIFVGLLLPSTVPSISILSHLGSHPYFKPSTDRCSCFPSRIGRPSDSIHPHDILSCPLSRPPFSASPKGVGQYLISMKSNIHQYTCQRGFRRS
ncbi:hypothetical protein ARMGADRAFT_690741 [Armillaria gallica]|uniref:Uncharacterized protein n=1 Tax=Armillaria gallica TaxID=47427 RepID=A0A2H3DM34_ARMGA|nr:hypothetical protein ARMGADRAFT_690741 [Armillaria gallica]